MVDRIAKYRLEKVSSRVPLPLCICIGQGSVGRALLSSAGRFSREKSCDYASRIQVSGSRVGRVVTEPTDPECAHGMGQLRGMDLE